MREGPDYEPAGPRPPWTAIRVRCARFKPPTYCSARSGSPQNLVAGSIWSDWRAPTGASDARYAGRGAGALHRARALRRAALRPGLKLLTCSRRRSTCSSAITAWCAGASSAVCSWRARGATVGHLQPTSAGCRTLVACARDCTRRGRGRQLLPRDRFRAGPLALRRHAVAHPRARHARLPCARSRDWRRRAGRFEESAVATADDAAAADDRREERAAAPRGAARVRASARAGQGRRTARGASRGRGAR